MRLIDSILTGKKSIAEDTVLISLVPSEPYSYRSGQHADCFLYNKDGKIDTELSRTFSFCSTPADKEINFVFRTSSSSYKQQIIGLPLGSLIAISQPKGYFGQSITEIPTLFIAGGVGIAPFRSLLFSRSKRMSSLHLMTVNSGQTREFFNDEFKWAQKQWVWFKYKKIVTNNLTQEKKSEFVKATISQASHFEDFYICGSSGFIDNVRENLQTCCIDPSRIKSEDFGIIHI